MVLPYGYVYGLYDPRTGVLRYVGKTVKTPDQRLRGHLINAEYKGTIPSKVWIRDVLLCGLRPLCRTLAIGSDSADLNKLEREFIHSEKLKGTPLTNVRSGGNGGEKRSAEACARIAASRRTPAARARTSETQKGRAHSVEHNSKVSLAKKGVPVPLDRRLKISTTLTGRLRSPEASIKAGESNRGRKRTPAQIEKTASKNRGKVRSPEARLRMKEAQAMRRRRERGEV